ncbi:hypothetical protein [Streptomyces humi]
MLENKRLSNRAKVLILYLFTLVVENDYEDAIRPTQEQLCLALGENSNGDTIRQSITEAEYEGYLKVDRAVKPHRYYLTDRED